MNPQPLACILLLLTLPGLGWAAAALIRPLRQRDRVLGWFLTPVVVIALWIVAVALAARWTSSLDRGLAIGMLVVAGAGAWARWRWRRPAAEPPPPDRSSAAMMLTAIAVAVPIAVIAFGDDFFDERRPNGHLGIISQMQNDSYPPPNQLFPDLPLRYHYGFNLAAAGVTAMTRLPISAAMDGLTVSGWLLSWCLLWLLGDRLGGRGAGRWVAGATLLGGGAATLFGWCGASPLASMSWGDLLGSRLMLVDQPLNPPLVAYFYQKPFALGIPLALAVMLVACERAEGWHTRRDVVLGLLLAAVSLTQTVLFVTVLPTLTAVELGVARRRRFPAVAAGSLALAAAMGGLLFTALPEGAELGLVFRVWSLEAGVPQVLAWQLLSLGALLPLGVWGYCALRRMRLFFALLIGGCLIVPNVVGYLHTWDIVKFFTVAALGLGILSGLGLARLAARDSRRARLGLVALVVLLTATPVTWVTLHVGRVGVERFSEQRTPEPPDDVAAAGWLRRHVAPGELVLITPSRNLPYVGYGLPLAGPMSGTVLTFGPPRDRFDARRALLDQLPRDLQPYLDQGIRWLVLRPGDTRIRGHLPAWREDGRAEQKVEFGRLVIYRLKGNP